MGWSGKVYLLSSAIPLHVLLGFQKELIANSLQSLKSNFKWATMYSLPTKAVLTVSGIQKWPLNFQIQWNYNSPSFYLIDLIHLILLSTFFRKLYLLLLLGPWSWSFICLFLALAGCYSPFLIHWILYVSGFCFWSLITLYKLLGQMLVAFILPVNSSLYWSIFTRSMLYLMRHFENLWWLKKKIIMMNEGRELLVFTRQGPGSILQCIGRSFPHNTELFCALHDFAILHVSIKPDYNCTDPESRSIYHKIPKKILFIFYRTLNLLECNECANQ